MSQNERQLVQGALGRSPDGTAPAKLSSSVPRPMPAACQCTPRCLMGHLYWKSGSAAMADAASLRRKPDLRAPSPRPAMRHRSTTRADIDGRRPRDAGVRGRRTGRESSHDGVDVQTTTAPRAAAPRPERPGSRAVSLPCCLLSAMPESEPSPTLRPALVGVSSTCSARVPAPSSSHALWFLLLAFGRWLRYGGRSCWSGWLVGWQRRPVAYAGTPCRLRARLRLGLNAPLV